MFDIDYLWIRCTMHCKTIYDQQSTINNSELKEGL